MQTTFDFEKAQRAKEIGMTTAADNKKALLEYARGIAVELGRKGDVSADDVQRVLEARGISVRALGNAAGSLFERKKWEWTGRFVKSQREHSHSNLLRVWRLRDAVALRFSNTVQNPLPANADRNKGNKS